MNTRHRVECLVWRALFLGLAGLALAAHFTGYLNLRVFLKYPD